MNKPTRRIVRAAVIATLYAALTLCLAPFAFGPVQFRISEALTVLPLFTPDAIWGLIIGCLIANIFSGSMWDILIGTLATALAAVLTRVCKKVYLGIIPPIIINALLVPVVFLTIPGTTEPYFLSVLMVGVSELVSVVCLGVPLHFALKRVDAKLPSLFN